MNAFKDGGDGATTSRTSNIAAAAILGSVILLACLFGILTRPINSLAAIWPANALLLGLIVRFSSLGRPVAIAAAFLAMVTADLITGNTLQVTMWLSTANLIGVLTGWAMFRLYADETVSLQHPTSVLQMFGACIAAATFAAISGGGASTLIFGRDFVSGMQFWFVTEVLNYLILLPIILTFPGIEWWKARTQALVRTRPSDIYPVAALLGTMLSTTIIGGPGAVAFAVPALIWCALSYSVFATAVLTSLSCSWLLVGIPAGLIDIVARDPVDSTISIRLGIALTALGPLTIASISAARETLIRQLAHAADHDALTEALSRRAFLVQGSSVLEKDRRLGLDTAVVMIDVDHFKQINDRYGHACGDQVLTAFASFISSRLRCQDIFGRLGGEEFALVLQGMSLGCALAVAESLRVELADLRLVHHEIQDVQVDISITISVGLAGTALIEGGDLEALLVAADSALYQAKRSGRNRIVTGQAVSAVATEVLTDGEARLRRGWSG